MRMLAEFAIKNAVKQGPSSPHLIVHFYDYMIFIDMVLKYIGISLQEEVFNKLEDARGNILRSKFISKLIQEMDKKR